LAGTVVAALLYFRPFATRMPAWVVVYAEAVFIPGTLLSVDTVAGTVTLGNPLQGRQELALAQLDGYWIGEAVLVGANRR
jgi:hypothetical protein